MLDLNKRCCCIQGTVLFGPICPVERIPPDPLCAPRPGPARVQVRRADDTVVAEVAVGTDGRFSIPVVPGVYRVSAAASTPGPGRGLPGRATSGDSGIWVPRHGQRALRHRYPLEWTSTGDGPATGVAGAGPRSGWLLNSDRGPAGRNLPPRGHREWGSVQREVAQIVYTIVWVRSRGHRSLKCVPADPHPCRLGETPRGSAERPSFSPLAFECGLLDVRELGPQVCQGPSGRLFPLQQRAGQPRCRGQPCRSLARPV